MVGKSLFLLALTGPLSALAAPGKPIPREEPCAKVQQYFKDLVKEGGEGEDGALPSRRARRRKKQEAGILTAAAKLSVPGELAHKCLQSMPFDSKNATAFLQEYRKFAQWQSTLEILKDPPSGYASPAVDILGGFDKIQTKAAKCQYKSQYEFDTDLQGLVKSANDGHFSINTCSPNAMSFGVDLPLVSVSTDGIELPQVYVRSDAALRDDVDGNWDVSPIISINGQPAEKELLRLSQPQGYQDPDARYNQMFSFDSRSVAELNPLGSFTTYTTWPGRSEFEVKFSNGTVIKKPVVGVPGPDMNITSFSSGRTLLEHACLSSPPAFSLAQPEEPPETESTEDLPAPPMYPKAEMRDRYNYISGYYLRDDDLDDVAVLNIPTFDPSNTDDSPGEFANQSSHFIENAVKDGKKKIVIDLTLNLGGLVNSGYDLFKLFFPEEEIYSASRLRAHEAIDVAGQALAPIDMSSEKGAQKCANSSSFCLANFVKPNQQGHFASWKELYGPHEQFGGNMTSLHAQEDFNWSSNGEGPIRGYGDIKQTPKKAPFAPEDILLITDGSCTSTCVIFSELMKNQGGVKSMAFGGRPQTGPMQALGGSKGNEASTGSLIAGIASVALQQVKGEKLKKLASVFPDPLRIPFNLDFEGVSLNLRSGYRKGEDVVPLQFIYEAADCRRFFTFTNTIKPASMWVDAARTFWGEGDCVSGSTSH